VVAPSKQQQAIVDVKKIYHCFTVSNEKVSNVRQQLIQNLERNEETEQVASGIQTGEHFFTGMADSDALRKIGMEHTASAKVAAPKKKRRRQNMPASNTNHLFDRVSRLALQRQEEKTEIANTVTQKSEDFDFPGGIGVGSLVYRTSLTPMKNGRTAKHKPLRNKPLLQLFGNMPPPLLDGIRGVCHELNYDFNFVPHGEMPPIKAFNKSNQHQRIRPLEEILEEADADVRSGLATRWSGDLNDL
jgi:DNA-binding protein H-NS